MKSIVKGLHSPDIDDLIHFRPLEPESFGFLLQVFIGPEFEMGEESFDIFVCTPHWLLNHSSGKEYILGNGLMIVFEYKYERLSASIKQLCGGVEGLTWGEIANKLRLIGKWEFESYGPNGNLSS